MNKRKPEVSAFQRRVYDALCEVPRGMVTTYRLLAEAVGCGSARAVGQALMRNPFAPRVPCHRVIRSDLTIGGFAGERAGADIRRKKALLRKEGVAFDGDRLANPEQVYRFPQNAGDIPPAE